jgi:hypothetical protein
MEYQYGNLSLIKAYRMNDVRGSVWKLENLGVQVRHLGIDV